MNTKYPTRLDLLRVQQLLNFAHHVIDKGVEGDFIECGVWKGGMVTLLAKIIISRNQKRKIYALDSFHGLPPDLSNYDTWPEWKSGYFSDVCLVDVLHFWSDAGVLPVIEVMAGWFKDTLPKLISKQFALVHIDCDIYKSTMTCLECLYPLLSSGGIMVIDDYNLPQCEGVKWAVDQFFHNFPEKIFFGAYPSVYVIRSR